MAAKEKEIVRQLDDGFAVAWDTTEVPEEVRTTFREAVDGHVDLVLKALSEDDELAGDASSLASGAK